MPASAMISSIDVAANPFGITASCATSHQPLARLRSFGFNS